MLRPHSWLPWRERFGLLAAIACVFIRSSEESAAFILPAHSINKTGGVDCLFHFKSGLETARGIYGARAFYFKDSILTHDEAGRRLHAEGRDGAGKKREELFIMARPAGHEVRIGCARSTALSRSGIAIRSSPTPAAGTGPSQLGSSAGVVANRGHSGNRGASGLKGAVSHQTFSPEKRKPRKWLSSTVAGRNRTSLAQHHPIKNKKPELKNQK